MKFEPPAFEHEQADSNPAGAAAGDVWPCGVEAPTPSGNGSGTVWRRRPDPPAGALQVQRRSIDTTIGSH